MVTKHWIDQFEKLQALSPQDRGYLEQNTQQMTVPEGAQVFESGAPCGAFLIVLSGSVRVQMTSENGREIVLYRVEDGQTCILTTACLLAQDAYNAEAITEVETTAVALPVNAFNQLLAQSKVFREMVFANYGERIKNLVLLVEEVAFGRLDVRLAQFLAKQGGVIRKTHYDLAVELGTAREVISRQLKEFEKKGWIKLSRGQVEITDAHALDDFILAQCD